MEIYDEWEDKIANDEWYFSNAFESITNGMSAEEAYNYIPSVIDLMLKLDDDFLLGETIYFLIGIYNIADTTEIHPYLENNWFVLTQHLNNYQESNATPFKELKMQLRIKD
ncbi:ABC transporter [Metabacillus malikii]|nr:ABC transporter [Metabacillus malikii]